MPRPKTDLDAWRVDVEHRIIEGRTQKEIITFLNGEGIVVSRSTLQANLRSWGTESNYTRLRNQLQNPSIAIDIHNLWSQQLEDSQIAEVLTTQGISLSTR